MYYPPPRRGSNSTGIIILVIVVMCCMFVMPALGFGAWTLFKKDDKEETTDDTDETSGPQLTFDQDATKTINENENTEPADETGDTDETTQVDDSTTSTYKIEYAGGGDGSDAIDLTLSWTNGTGFDEVKTLKFVRTVNGTELQTESTTDETATSNDGKGSITFKGTNIADGVASAVGDNKIEVFAYDSEDKALAEGKSLADVMITISQDDLDQTYEGPYGDLTVPVTLAAGSMDLKKFIKKTYYSISHAPEYWFEIEKSGDNVKFKRKSGMYLSIGGVDVFRLQKYKGRLVIMNTGTDKIYVPGRGMRVKTEMTTEEYWLAQCDLIGASLIAGNEENSVRQGVDFVSPNKQFFANYQTDGNFVVYKGSGSSDNKGAMWSSGTTGGNTIKDGQIVMRPRYNNETYAALSFSSKKDLAGGNIKKEMISTNTGVKPYKLLISDVGRLVVTDSNGQNMVMGGGGDNLQYFFQSTHGSVCGSDLSNSSNGGGSVEAKQQVCAKKCYETDECIGFAMNDNTCFFKKANFLNTGTHTSQGCINAHEKNRLNNTDKYDHTGFKYREGTCEVLNTNNADAVSQCPGKLTPEACVRSKMCAWNPVNSKRLYSSYPTDSGLSETGTISTFFNEPYTVKSKTEFTASKMRNKYVNKSTGELGSFSNSYWKDASKPFSEHMEACKAKCNQFDNCKAIQFVPGENYCSMMNADANNSNITNSDNRVEIHIKPS